MDRYYVELGRYEGRPAESDLPIPKFEKHGRREFYTIRQAQFGGKRSGETRRRRAQAKWGEVVGLRKRGFGIGPIARIFGSSTGWVSKLVKRLCRPATPARVFPGTLSPPPDNLNTHRTASPYETFPPAEARRIAQRLEFHYTPRHGNWLNMTEMNFGVLARACLRERNPDQASLEQAVNACVSERNAAAASINWRFTTRKARTKFPSAVSRKSYNHKGDQVGLSKIL